MSHLRRGLTRLSALAMDAESGGPDDHAGFNRCPCESSSLARLIGAFEPEVPLCIYSGAWGSGFSLAGF
jgi:hypothetical protein